VLGADGAREKAVAIDYGRDLVTARGVDGFAAVQGLERGKVVGLGLDAVCNAEQCGGALTGGGARPCAK